MAGRAIDLDEITTPEIVDPRPVWGSLQGSCHEAGMRQNVARGTG